MAGYSLLFFLQISEWGNFYDLFICFCFLVSKYAYLFNFIARMQIRNMEHAIQHETLPLREEKQLIREIKQLKQLREQLSSNMGRQDDVQQALDQKEQIEERFKVQFSGCSHHVLIFM